MLRVMCVITILCFSTAVCGVNNIAYAKSYSSPEEEEYKASMKDILWAGIIVFLLVLWLSRESPQPRKGEVLKEEEKIEPSDEYKYKVDISTKDLEYNKSITVKITFQRPSIKKIRKIYKELDSKGNPTGGTIEGYWKTAKVIDNPYKPLANAKISFEGDNIFYYNDTTKHTFFTDQNGMCEVRLSTRGPFQFPFVGKQKSGFTNLTSHLWDQGVLEEKRIKVKIEHDEDLIESKEIVIKLKNFSEAIKAFVEREINQRKIKRLRIRTLNIDTHYPISKAKITLKGNPPSPETIVRKYFLKESFVEYAISLIPPYLRGEQTKNSGYDTGEAYFSVYIPFSYQLRVVHPLYYYVEKEISVSADELNKTVLMSETGQKMRVEILNK